jgi:hypothetical protein
MRLALIFLGDPEGSPEASRRSRCRAVNDRCEASNARTRAAGDSARDFQQTVNRILTVFAN